MRIGLGFLCVVLVSCEKPEPRPAAPDLSIPVAPGPRHVGCGPAGLCRDGKPYFVQGAGGDAHMRDVAARGGNSIRTWTTGGLDRILDEAGSLGLTVSAGIWLESECSWFSYANPEHCDRQAERVRGEVMAYKDHPALLAWGIGNEVEGDGRNVAFWKQLNRLARMVGEWDAHHPTFTAMAWITPTKAAALNQHVPELDFVGINTYGGAAALRAHLRACGWSRPWMLTEWGPRGFWEAKKGAGGAPIEQTSTEKAEMIAQLYPKVIAPTDGCLGSYVFLWGWKFEATSTWFGIVTHEGETTATADVLQKAWSGREAVNKAPAIDRLSGVPREPLAPGAEFTVSVKVVDPEGDSLRWNWGVYPEAKIHDGQKRFPMPPPAVDSHIEGAGPSAKVRVPSRAGVYRLHVWASDGHGHAATANMPFEVVAP